MTDIRTRRSYETVTDDHLARLGELARNHHAEFEAAHPAWARTLLGVYLAQGAAAHRVGGTKGVKDLDVWLFYALPEGRRSSQVPWNRYVRHVDFGRSAHGRQLYTDEERADPQLDVVTWDRFIGRRVDLTARAIRSHAGGADAAVLAWLSGGSKAKGSSAWWLAQAPVVKLYPRPLGHVVWRPQRGNSSARQCRIPRAGQRAVALPRRVTSSVFWTPPTRGDACAITR